ncbi:MAG: GNAT family N-acetyltransferase [Elusimicrobiota bacterium]|nr:MAG: GNAT family N-acetyltransferase [Elusimicrobiota bacterium]
MVPQARPRSPGLRLRGRGKVVGWASLSPYSDRCAYAATCEISVYIDEKARGRGHGGALLDSILAAGKKAGLRQVIARISEGNEASVALHVKRGFFEAGRLRQVGEKFGRVLDVFFLQKTLALLLLFAAAPARAGVEEALRESVVRLTAGDVAGARAKAEEAAAAAPRDARAHEQLGLAALASLDAAEAERSASRALALGETPARLVLRANARLAAGKLDGARADAERAAALAPGSGRARLVLALSLESRGRRADAEAEYKRAAELDASLAADAEAGLRRLAPPPPPPVAADKLGPILVILAVSALFGWVWGKASRADEELEPEAARAPLLPGTGRLTPREALAAAVAAAKSAPDPLELAEALYARLTGRPAFPRGTDRSMGRYLAPSTLAKGAPAGLDAFFARAFDPDPARRFPTADALVGALRSLVDPPVL